MLSFDDTAHAFAYKTNSELKRSRFLFSTMGNQILLKLGLWLMPAAVRFRIPFSYYLVRQTIFQQFVGGENLQQTAKVADKLQQYNVQVILDYGVEGGEEGEKGFDEATEQFISVVDYAASQSNIPFISIKVTGIVRFTLLETMNAMISKQEGTLMKRYSAVLEILSVAEREEWQRVVSRLLRISDEAFKKGVSVLIDAEETWIQDPVDALTILMMDKLNREKAVVYNTLQLYRHDRLEFLKACLDAAKERNFVLGAKLVRGAYMEKERIRASEMGYPSPIQKDKKACDDDFNNAVLFCIENIDQVALIVASHNEYSNLYTTELMEKYKLVHNHSRVHLSQLYGMSDNITFNLADAGYSVSKYLPFGPIKDVIPYLLRRAQENSSVSGQTGRELALIEKELERRKTQHR